MGSISLDILRQSGWDLWVWVDLAAAAALAVQGVLTWLQGRLARLGWALGGVGIAGTLLIVAVPPLHVPWIGLIWTFILLSLLSWSLYRNLSSRLGRRRTGTLLAMRLAALALLVPMLFEPVLRFTHVPQPERPLMVLVDTSGSMSVPDVPNGPTRIQSVWQALQPQLPRLSAHFVPRYFSFSTTAVELKRPDDLATIAADGKSTDLVGAVNQSLFRVTRDDAAVVLISDGNDNTTPDVIGALGAVRRPVHTVVVGSDQAQSALLANVAVDDLTAGGDFVVGHENKITALIRSTALTDRLVDVKLAEVADNGETSGAVQSEKLVLQSTAAGQPVQFTYKPATVGVHRIAVWIDPIPGERTTADNRQELQGLALDPRIKVLYIEGRARPEYRELSRALNRDPNIELATLLRLQQDRFAAGGTVDGSPFAGMPDTAQKWKQFDVIVLGDLDASYLGTTAESAIEQMVSSGGGLLMLGGESTFAAGGYTSTPIERASPVNFGEKSAAAQEQSEFVPRLTVDGAAHPAMEGLRDWFGEGNTGPTRTLPALLGNAIVGPIKNGAEVLLEHADRTGPGGMPQVVLAVEHYGKGRSAVFTADTTYRWYLPLRGMGQESPYNRMWGQLVRWLAGEDVRNRQEGAGVEALLNKSVYQLGETVHLRAMVRDEKGDATRYAQVSARISPVEDEAAGGSASELPMPPVESHTGLYAADQAGLGKGQWKAEIVATKDGKEIGRRTVKFSVLPPADEMLKIAANPKLMAGIAAATRGNCYPLSQLNDLVSELIRTDPSGGKPTQESVPLHNALRALMALMGHNPQWPQRVDLPMQGGLAMCLLVGEWLLRRKWQLA